MTVSGNILQIQSGAIFVNQHQIARDINVTIKPAQTVAVSGPKGSGKSEFIRLLSGLLAPEEGVVFYREEAFLYEQNNHFFRQRQSISYLIKKLQPILGLTVYDNVALYYWMNTDKTPTEIDHAVLQKLECLELYRKRDLLPVDLTTEERIVLSVLMNIKEDSQLFVIDEIFAFLSAMAIEALRDTILAALRDKSTTVLSNEEDGRILGIDCDLRLVVQDFKLEEVRA